MISDTMAIIGIVLSLGLSAVSLFLAIRKAPFRYSQTAVRE